ncbi:hypothetical protein [Cellulophaga sp. E6(2014)]|uniref:hypothetical protein n=1 Tax=Cellulophaga sp. E6(2014) TaxID=1495334 RepID=UPI00051E082E|nr:hypothetical protein [Cellulophaga sp. E6(2014)]KGK28738.1 hypothetical protein EL45_19220 [Cellulophaga sp. E6(2014)]
MNKFQGTWLMIKDSYTYCYPEFIEFQNDQVLYFKLLDKAENGLLEKQQNHLEKLSETKHEFVADNRIRIYRMGKTLTVISDTESISEETEFATDYERIEPTKTDLTEKEIQKMDLKAEWNGEKIRIVFNKNLDSPTIQKINKRLKKEGEKLVLENLHGTYFASLYGDGESRTLIGIREINIERAVLFGFPEKPYEVIAYLDEKH